MKARLIQRTCTVLAILTILAAPLAGLQKAFGANVTLTVDGSQIFQTIDGFGVNANSASWNGTELVPAVDSLINNGSRIWRVVIDDQDWEATNDDSDPNNYNWTAYNSIYSSPKFEKLWGMIAYLNSRGITDKVIICPMGKAANWMGGLMLTDTSTIKNEYAEMITSMAIYGHQIRGLQFSLEPNNEPDIETEGVRMSGPVQAEVLNNIAVRLDAAGMTSMRIFGPSAGVIQYAVAGYTDYMHNYPTLMAHVDAYSYHDYNGSTGNAASIIASSAYPNKKFYMTEFSQFDDGMAMLSQGPQAMLVWDGYDSVYNHPLDRGGSSTAPNDAGDGPALLAYDSGAHTYTPRKEFYQFAQLFKYVPAGSVRVGATASGGGMTTYAFRDNVSSRLTIVGKNTSSSSNTMTISLNNVGVPPATMAYYQTNTLSNMTQGADVSVVNGVATVTVPANTIFTLTGLGTPDSQAPTAPANLSGSAATATSANLSWDAATDNVGVANYVVKRNGTAVGQPTATNFTDNGLTAETTYTYTVQAKDVAGNLSPDSNAVTVTTPAAPTDTQAPAVTITAPTTGATVGGTVNVAASASDNTGVVGVQFKLDGVKLGAEDITAPYGINWDTTPLNPGSHTLSAVARDAAGNTATASDVMVSVNNAPDVVLLGSQTIQSNTDTDPAGTAEAFRYTATATGAAAALKLYISSGTTATSVKVGIYSNNTSHPGTLLASGTITSPVNGAWNTATLSPSVTLSSGTTYWIGFLGTGGQLSYKDTTTGSCSESPAGNLSALPATWTTGTAWSSCTASAYVLSGTADTTAPTAPSSLSANGIGNTSANLTWTTATDNVGVTGYQILRDGTAIATTSSSSYNDTSLTPGTTYNYAVKAYDAAGNFSAASNTVSVTTSAPDTSAPSIAFTAPTAGQTVNGTITVSASGSDNVGVAGVQFKLDGVNLGAEDTAAPHSISWNTVTATNGVHSLTATARDAAGNTATATMQVTVSNSAASLAADVVVSTNQTAAASTISSPSFSTAQPNELLIAFISSDGPAGAAQTYSTVTGGGLTWTLRKRVNTRAGTAEIWTAYATSALNNATVTAARSRTGYVGSITIAAFTGASSTIGATGGNNAATGAATVSLTATKAGSLVWGVGNDWDGAAARTVGSNQTMVNQYLASVGDTFWVQRANNPSTAVGQNVTLNDTAPTNHRWNYASIEILPL